MISKDEPGNRRSPLADYAETTGSPIMREFARIALVKGHTQQSLARAMGEKVAASHVIGWFATEKPQRKTVSRLAACLGVDDQHVRLVQNQPLGDDELREAETLVLREVRRNSRLTADAAQVIQKALSGAPQEIRRRALAAYLLADHRTQIGLIARPQRYGISGALRAFADELGDRFNLRSILRSGDQLDFLLLELYLMLTKRFDLYHGTAESILAVLRPSLQLANFSVDRMDEVLHSSVEFRGGIFQMKPFANTVKREHLRKASKDQQS